MGIWDLMQPVSPPPHVFSDVTSAVCVCECVSLSVSSALWQLRHE